MLRTDRLERHLAIRTTKKGFRTYYFQAKLDGLRIRQSLAAVDDLTLPEARKLAHLKYIDLLRGGSVKKLRRTLFSDVANNWLNMHAKYHRKTISDDKHRLNCYLLPAFGRKFVDEITTRDIEELHEKITQHHIHLANRVTCLIRTILNKALADGLIPRNPAQSIRLNKEVPRHRYLTTTEAPALLSAINDCENPYAKTLFKMYLLTGCRKSELLNLQWPNIDLVNNRIDLGITKNGERHIIPITEHAKALLLELPHQKDKVFPVKYKPFWNSVREAAGLKDFHLHDLRRTVASWLAQDGVSTSIIGAYLNHKGEKVTLKHYIRQNQDSMRKAADRIEQLVTNYA